MLRPLFAVCLGIATVFSMQAHASSGDVFELTATNAEEFRQQADALRNELNAGGKYASLSSDDKARVSKQLDTLQGLYDDRVARKEFTRKDEVKLVNASEEINGLLTGDEGDRLVCEQVRKLGSNRTEKVCLTVAERRERREEAAKDLRNQRTNPYNTAGG